MIMRMMKVIMMKIIMMMMMNMNMIEDEGGDDNVFGAQEML